MTKIADALRAALMTEEGKSWPTFNGGTLLRHEFVTASEATKCPRSLALSKHAEHDKFIRTGGVKNDTFWDDMSDEEYAARLEQMGPESPYGIFARGNEIEDWIVRMLKSVELSNERYLFLGKQQVSFYVANHFLSGTPDGLHIDFDTNKMSLLEFKSSNAPTVSPRPAHVAQVLVNMGIIKMLLRHNKLPADREEFAWMEACVDNFETGVLTYVRADNYLDIAEFEIPWDGGEAYNKAMHKAKALFTVIDGVKTLIPAGSAEPTGLQNKYMCRFCDHKTACLAIEQAKHDEANVAIIKQMLAGDDYEVPRVPFFAQGEKEKILTTLIQFNDYKKAAKEAEAHADAMRDAIMEWAKTQPGMKASFASGDDAISVSYRSQTREGGIDKEALSTALEAVGLSIDTFTKKSSTFDVLTVAVKAAKK